MANQLKVAKVLSIQSFTRSRLVPAADRPRTRHQPGDGCPASEIGIKTSQSAHRVRRFKTSHCEKAPTGSDGEDEFKTSQSAHRVPQPVRAFSGTDPEAGSSKAFRLSGSFRIWSPITGSRASTTASADSSVDSKTDRRFPFGGSKSLLAKKPKSTLAPAHRSSTATAGAPDACLASCPESFAQGLQRIGLSANDRQLDRCLGKCVSALWRRSQDTGPRQPESRRHQGRLVRPGSQSEAAIILRTLRHRACCRPSRARLVTKAKSNGAWTTSRKRTQRSHVSRAWRSRTISCLHWESTVADTRIHGTTSKQVKKLFRRNEQSKLGCSSARSIPHVSKKLNGSSVATDTSQSTSRTTACRRNILAARLGSLGLTAGASFQRPR